jgi:hypothetical protein
MGGRDGAGVHLRRVELAVEAARLAWRPLIVDPQSAGARRRAVERRLAHRPRWRVTLTQGRRLAQATKEATAGSEGAVPFLRSRPWVMPAGAHRWVKANQTYSYVGSSSEYVARLFGWL